MKRMDWFSKLGRLLFPSCCLVCGDAASAKAEGLCASCLAAYLKERELVCPHCGRKAARCICAVSYLKKQVFPGITAAVSRFYNPDFSSDIGEMTRSLILRGKRETNRALFSVLSEDPAIRVGGILYANGEDCRDWIVTYVPRNPANLLKHGCDQGESIAKAMAKRLGCPFVPTLSRHTGEMQKTLPSDERYDNAKSGLAIKRGAVVNGGKYILVDDVLTTGATMAIAAELLYVGGAAAVLPTAVAKTMRIPQSDGSNH